MKALIGLFLLLGINSQIEVARVTGTSMHPFLEDGDFVLVRKRRPKVGEVVTASIRQNNKKTIIVKRILKENKNLLWLEGDNPKNSLDSRTFGWVDKDSITGVVISVFK